MPFGNSRGQGFNSIITALLEAANVVIDKRGMFLYSPKPGAGNLLASLAPLATTSDKFGNAVQGDGLTIYNAGETVTTTITPNGIGFQNITSGIATLFSILSGQLVVTGTGTGQSTVTYDVPVTAADSLMVASGSVAKEWYSSTADATGAADWTALATALGNGYSVEIGPGTVYLDQPLQWQKAEFAGCGMNAIVKPGSLFSGTSLFALESNATVRNIQANGLGVAGLDVVRVPSGVFDWWVFDLYAINCPGYYVNVPALTGATHGKIRNLQGGAGMGGGINVQAATGGKSAQINIDDIDIQSLTTFPAYTAVNAVDMIIDKFNASVLSSANVPTWHMQGGGCQASKLDIGVISSAANGVPVVLLEDSPQGAVSGSKFTNCLAQEGGLGWQISGGTARCSWSSCSAERSQGDGWRFDGTGTNLGLAVCSGNQNNLAGLVGGYDVDVLSTAHVGLFGFGYNSPATTAGRNIALAGNHVTDVSPTNLTFAGNAPAGW